MVAAVANRIGGSGCAARWMRAASFSRLPRAMTKRLDGMQASTRGGRGSPLRRCEATYLPGGLASSNRGGLARSSWTRGHRSGGVALLGRTAGGLAMPNCDTSPVACRHAVDPSLTTPRRPAPPHGRPCTPGDSATGISPDRRASSSRRRPAATGDSYRCGGRRRGPSPA